MTKTIPVQWVLEDPDGYGSTVYTTHVDLSVVSNLSEEHIKRHIYNSVDQHFRNIISWDLEGSIDTYVGKAQDALEVSCRPRKPLIDKS